MKNLDEIEKIMQDIEYAREVFENTRKINLMLIDEIIEKSTAYKELKKECTGYYSCYVIETSVKVRFYNVDEFCNLVVSITKDGIVMENRSTYEIDKEALEKLNAIATKFHDEFYLGKSEKKTA